MMNLQKVVKIGAPSALVSVIYYKMACNRDKLHEQKMAKLKELKEILGVPEDATPPLEVYPKWSDQKVRDMNASMYYSMACGGLVALGGIACRSRFITAMGNLFLLARFTIYYCDGCWICCRLFFRYPLS